MRSANGSFHVAPGEIKPLARRERGEGRQPLTSGQREVFLAPPGGRGGRFGKRADAR